MLVSGREKGAAKAPLPYDAEGGQVCGTLGLCSHPAHGVAKAPDKGCGTDMLLLPGAGVRAGL